MAERLSLGGKGRHDMRDDYLIFTPDEVDLARSPLRGRCEAETYVLGAFNPGMTRLASGNLLLMVRVAEALVDPQARSLRWDAERYVVDAWPAARVDTSDPRIIKLTDEPWTPLALTSISWLLPVELTPDGEAVVAVHYDRAIVPAAPYQAYGIEDARISRIDGRWWMTCCSVSPERLGTSLYSSDDARDWRLEGLVLDHQNKDMLLFEGRIDWRYWAQTRPLGETWFAYPPGSDWRAGPAINLATSPDLLHWKPHEAPGLRPHAATVSTARMGGGAPPMLTDDGWLSLWHGVEPGGEVGIYRTYWTLLDRDDPSRVIRTEHDALIEPAPHLTAHIAHQKYLDSVVFTTGIVDLGDQYLVASGEADLACRLTRIDKARFA
ncbi:glycoside hydrolase family 130 protein [Sphingomonas baiyangensis]|uniref:Glycosidase n=1 Tax=Sphingomonas baiyangensis TaxID=2572576 RepID=A0A4U1L429_9SPHN|nr:glycosidase [Sphingomonas baiyangensis]TKD51681.1 glycosidase [Sphingomonas baiyangensis]